MLTCPWIFAKELPPVQTQVLDVMLTLITTYLMEQILIKSTGKNLLQQSLSFLLMR